jgi:predicted PurR-regulated permease PerM
VSTSRSPLQVVAWSIVMVGGAIVIASAIYQVRHVLMLIYAAGLLAVGFAPIVRYVERQKMLPVGTRRFPRWLAILTIYLALLCTVVGIGFAVFPPLVEQARGLGAKVPQMFARGQRFLLERGLIDQEITVTEAIKKAPTDVVGAGGDAVTTVLQALVGLAGGLFGILTVLILTFYMLVDSAAIFERFVRLFPRDQRRRVAAVSSDISDKVSAWLGGQLLLGAVIGVTATIGLWLLGVPYFFVLGLIAGLGELMPMVGPLLSAIPAVLVALTVSPGLALGTAIFFLLQQQFENHVLVPKVMSAQVGVSAVTVVIALLIGGSLLGIVGALLAVPTAAALQVVFDELTAERPEEPGPDTGPA